MINAEFDYIVSLGGHCQTAYQIRRYFGVEEAYPFDWWVTPTISLVELLETGFANLFDEKNMKIVEENTGPAVTCSHYGLMHYHDFDEAKIAGRYSPYLVRTACVQNNAKFSYLIKRLLSLSGKVLFVRYAHGWTQFDTRVCMFDEALVQRLMTALTNLFPKTEVHVLLLNDYNSHAGLDGQVGPKLYTSVVNNYEAQEWHGSNRGWDDLFIHHQIRLIEPK